MGSAFFCPSGAGFGLAGVIPQTEIRGALDPRCGVVYGQERLATDAIGTFILRLKNVVAGSHVRVEVKTTGALVEEFTAAGGDEDRTLSLYLAGSARNDLRVKVRNSDPALPYDPFETETQAQAGIVPVYVSQEPDA